MRKVTWRDGQREIKKCGDLVLLVDLKDEGEYLLLERLHHVNACGRLSHVEDMT